MSFWNVYDDLVNDIQASSLTNAYSKDPVTFSILNLKDTDKTDTRLDYAVILKLQGLSLPTLCSYMKTYAPEPHLGSLLLDFQYNYVLLAIISSTEQLMMNILIRTKKFQTEVSHLCPKSSTISIQPQIAVQTWFVYIPKFGCCCLKN
jgi:hypothetical protein